MNNEIAKKWIQLGIMYGRQLGEGTVLMMLEAISDLPFDSVLLVMKKWAASETKFPMPADIRAKILPELSTKDNAIDAVNAAIACVSKFGYTNSEAAKN